MATSKLKHTYIARPEVIHRLVIDNVAVESLATNTTYTADLAHGEYNISLSAYTKNDGPALGAIGIKVKPFLDPEQTLVGKALSMFELGSSTVATVLTIAATSVATGKIAEVIPDAGNAGARLSDSHILPIHSGVQILVDVNTNSGTSASEGDLYLELIARRQT